MTPPVAQKRRGRPPGPSSKPTNPRDGSLNARLATIEAVDDYLYLEVQHEHVQHLQARIQAASRYPDSMRDRRFSVAAFTAVPATGLGGVRILVRVQRIA